MSSSPRFSISAGAWSDITEILDVTRDAWGERQVQKYANALNRGLRTVEDFPDAGRRRDDLRPGLRIFPVERHVILYEKHGDTVVVLRIVHQRQRLDDLAFE